MTTESPDLDLLRHTQSLIHLERKLTAAINEAEPWLANNSQSRVGPFRERVRPIPRTMEQVEQVLALARLYSSRTSAPAGWNPNAPMMGFTGPNPMPHQLRVGALSDMQFKLARQAERDKKRKKAQDEELAKEDAKRRQEAEAVSEEAKKADDTTTIDPRSSAPMKQAPRKTSDRARPRASRNLPPLVNSTMNLSDSSSDSDDDSED